MQEWDGGAPATYYDVNDKKEILEIIDNKPWDLQFVQDKFKDDEEVVNFAVGRDGFTLYFASKRICDMKHIVMKALETCPMALKYASPRLQDDEEVVFFAIRRSHDPLYYASPRIARMLINR